MLRRMSLSFTLIFSLLVSTAEAASVLDAPAVKRYSSVVEELKKAKAPAERKKLLENFVGRVERDVASIPGTLTVDDIDRASEFFELQTYTKELRLDAVSQEVCRFNRNHTLALSNPRALDPSEASEIGRFLLEMLQIACRP